MRQALPLLTAVTGRYEASVAVALDAEGSRVEVVRRCADLGELLSTAAAGLGRAALISADLQRLDREAIVQLLELPVAVVGLAAPGDDAAVFRLSRLGVSRVLHADAPGEAIGDAVLAAYRELNDHRQHRRRAATAEQAASGAAAAHSALTQGDAPSFPDPLLAAGDPGSALPVPPRIPMDHQVAVALDGQAEDGRLIAVWGPVGAPGRTTVAITLAAELAAAGCSSLLVDADTYGASIAQALGLLDESAGLAAAARAANQGQLDVARLSELALVVGERLRVLTGLPQPRRWAELRPSCLDVVWEEARRLAECTVVDAGFGLDADEEMMFDTAAPRRHGATLSAVARADLVVAVGAGDPLGLQRLLASMPDLRDITGAATPIQVVITKVRDQAIGGSAAARVRGALQRYAGITDAVIIPDDRPALDAAMLAGRTLAEVAPASPARLAVHALAGKLLAAGHVLGDSRGLPATRSRPVPRGRWGRRRSTAGGRTSGS